MKDITDEEAANVALILISTERKLGRIDETTDKALLNSVVGTTLANRQNNNEFSKAETRFEKMLVLVTLLAEALDTAGILNRPDMALTPTEVNYWEMAIEREIEQITA